MQKGIDYNFKINRSIEIAKNKYQLYYYVSPPLLFLFGLVDSIPTLLY
jgi:hypothetical protein